MLRTTVALGGAGDGGMSVLSPIMVHDSGSLVSS